MTATRPTCEFCDKTVGPKIFPCPYLPDVGCPFEIKSSRASAGTKPGCMIAVLVFVGVWLALASLAFTDIMLNAQVISSIVVSVLALGCFWLVGTIFLAFSLYGLFGKTVVLYNPTNGIMAQYAVILGLPVGGGVSVGWEPVPPELCHFNLPAPLQYPASLSAWLNLDEAATFSEGSAYICQAALLGLAVQEVLEFKATTTHDTLLGIINRQTKRIMILPKQNHPRIDGGVLEQKIVDTLFNPVESPTRTSGMPLELHDVIAAIYDKDYLQPEKWLVELVESDLVSRGLSHKVRPPGITGWLKQRLELEPTHQSRLKSEYLIIKEKYSQLQTSRPEFIKALQAEITQAFKARTESSD